MKTCRSCAKELPLEEFHKKLEGRSARCQTCTNTARRAQRAANPEHFRAQDRASAARNRETRLARDRKYHAANRERRIVGNREWRQANAERYREYQRAYYQANRERIRERAEEWRLANPAEAREHRRLSNVRRRARLRDLPFETFTVADVWERDAVDGTAVCYLCELPVTLDEANIEHLIPIAARACDLERAGIANPGSVLVNVGLAHGGCNKSKGAAITPAALDRYRHNLGQLM